MSLAVGIVAMVLGTLILGAAGKQMGGVAALLGVGLSCGGWVLLLASLNGNAPF